MRTHVDSDYGRRSGRTIEPAGIDSNHDIVQTDREPLTGWINGINDNKRRQHACEKCMQPAARVGVIVSAPVMRMENSTGTICVAVMHMCRSNTVARHAGKW